MKIDAQRYHRLHGIMLSRGLPRALLRAHGVLERSDVNACTHPDTKPVPPQRQVKWLQQSMEKPLGDWVHVIGTVRDPDLIMLAGLEFFARRTLESIARPEYARPYWHAVTGGWGDRLRDGGRKDHEWRESIGRIGALVISGVTADCPAEKLEKVRDHLHLHEGVPRVVLVSGGDPHRFALDRLHRRAERVTFVNRSRARADRDQS